MSKKKLTLENETLLHSILEDLDKALQVIYRSGVVPYYTLKYLSTRIECQYTQNKRYYHNLKHIDFMLKELKELNHIEEETYHKLVLGVIFHDIIYKPGMSDNEKRSSDLVAEWFRGDSDFLESYHSVNEICIWITYFTDHSIQKHNCNNFACMNDYESAYLLHDLDLIHFAKFSTFEWLLYGKRIRQEFKQFPDAMFLVGHEKCFEDFLSKDKIYYSPVFEDQEITAREKINEYLQIIKEFPEILNLK